MRHVQSATLVGLLFSISRELILTPAGIDYQGHIPFVACIGGGCSFLACSSCFSQHSAQHEHRLFMAFSTLGIPPEVARGNPIVRTAAQKAADVALPEKVRGNHLGLSKFAAVALVMTVKIGIEQAVAATTGVNIVIPTFGLANKLARRMSRGPKKPSLKATTAKAGTSKPTTHSSLPVRPSVITMQTAPQPLTQYMHPLATHPLAGSPLAPEAVSFTSSLNPTMHSNVDSLQVLAENSAMSPLSLVSTTPASNQPANRPSVIPSYSSLSLPHEPVTDMSRSQLVQPNQLQYSAQIQHPNIESLNLLRSPFVQQPSLAALPTQSLNNTSTPTPTQSPDNTSLTPTQSLDNTSLTPTQNPDISSTMQPTQSPNNSSTMSQPLAAPTPLAPMQHDLQTQRSLVHDPAIR